MSRLKFEKKTHEPQLDLDKYVLLLTRLTRTPSIGYFLLSVYLSKYFSEVLDVHRNQNDILMITIKLEKSTK